MNRRQRSKLAGVVADKPDKAVDAQPIDHKLLGEHVQSLLSPGFVDTVYADTRLARNKRPLSAPLVAMLLVAFCVSVVPSFAALIQRLADGSLPGLPALVVSSQAFYQRLPALGHAVFLRLLVEVTKALRSSPGRRPWVTALAPWATAIYAIDDTTLDALVRRVPWLAVFDHGKPQTLAGRLGSMLDLSTGKLHEIVYDSDSGANEKTHLLPLLESVAKGAIVVFDLGYFAFPIFDQMTTDEVFFVTRFRKGTTFVVQQVLAQQTLYRDRIVYLGANRTDRAAHPVRLVELCLEGEWRGYLTNVLDPNKLAAEAVWRLYLERWSIEQAFFAIKRVLGMASLRCSNIDGVLAQVWTTLVVYQIVQDLRLEVAEAQGLGADDVSWARMMGRIVNYTLLPGPKPPLRDWLKTRIRMAKQGTRIRRLKQLPDDVLADCQLAKSSMPSLAVPPPRKARQGKPEPRRTQVLTHGKLSNPPENPKAPAP